MASVVVQETVYQVVGFGRWMGRDGYLLATGLEADHARRLAARRQADSDEDQDGTVWLVRPLVVDVELSDDDVDDWEGPQEPEYSERDDEAFDEMVRDDMAGRF
jgi:hypothetical protein